MLQFTAPHRYLMSALSSGWFAGSRQQPVLLGLRDPVENRPRDKTGAHPIPVTVEVDESKLPNVPVLQFDKNGWQDRTLSDVSRDATAVCWPGSLPVFAISGWNTPSEENSIRFSGLTQSFSNMINPDIPVEVAPADREVLELQTPSVAAVPGGGVELPEGYNRIAGAIGMAAAVVGDELPTVLGAAQAWCGPQPWLRDGGQVSGNQGPWPRNGGQGSNVTQRRLWNAARNAFMASEGGYMGVDQLDKIADDAMTGTRSTVLDDLLEWKRGTRAIMRMDKAIEVDCQTNPVGSAVRLALLRPSPDRHAKWSLDRDRLDITPPVLAMGAVLCGMGVGLSHLPTNLRGPAGRRMDVSVAALRASSTNFEAQSWPAGVVGGNIAQYVGAAQGRQAQVRQPKQRGGFGR